VRAILVVTEMAMSVVLLMGAGLLIRSVVELTRVDVGFRPQQAAAFRLMNVPGDTPERARNRVEEILARLRTLPGVMSAGATTTLPLRGRGAILTFEVVDAPPPPSSVNREILVAAVTPGYFETIGASLLDGRFVTERDRQGTPEVAVINEAALSRWFPDGQPLGRRVRAGGEFEIVGVVADARQDSPGRPAEPQLFVSQTQTGWGSGVLQFVMRARRDAAALAPLVRAELQALDSTLAVADFTPLEDLVTTSIARPRQLAGLMALFAGVALALAAGGVFGVMSFSVAQRTREICIRTALGAHVADTWRLVVGRAVILASVGVVVGLAGTLALGRLLRSELFNVPVLDPMVLGGVVLLLLASAVVASVLPARRAARLNVAGVLRES
jgi:predicted permease